MDAQHPHPHRKEIHHGRFSRPEIFTTRAASQRLKTLVIVENTAAAGGIRRADAGDGQHPCRFARAAA